MGSPKRNRRKFDKPKDIWNLSRINADNALIKEYGLKSMSELWKVQSELSRIRGNVRLLLSGISNGEEIEKKLKDRLERLGVIAPETPLEKLLELKESSLLDRRLQSVVFKKGMAKSMKQARQLITHGFISINGTRMNIPGYLVNVSDEPKIGFYKPIDLGSASDKAAAEAQAQDTGKEAEVAEAATE
ncbi:30S ribosomal protein S4 [Candidatus Marsarchaeota archaeon]|nr:30S ribosomal protein S4 [Candidatus Marsarchaeota archaeon]MCL5404563.1 30S ribosomal protein S4 [Candidatus Marsarchaeota archaeon]